MTKKLSTWSTNNEFGYYLGLLHNPSRWKNIADGYNLHPQTLETAKSRLVDVLKNNVFDYYEIEKVEFRKLLQESWIPFLDFMLKEVENRKVEGLDVSVFMNQNLS